MYYFKNLRKDPVTIYAPNNALTFPPSNLRTHIEWTPGNKPERTETEDGKPVTLESRMPLLGLDFPEPDPKVLYIVDHQIFRAAINTERSTADLLLPEMAVRNEYGEFIGFKKLRRLG